MNDPVTYVPGLGGGERLNKKTKRSTRMNNLYELYVE